MSSSTDKAGADGPGEVIVKVQRLSETATVPTKGTQYAAGYDLYADLKDTESIPIFSHSTIRISTGLAMEIQDGYFGAIVARSGIATKRGLRPANCIGIVDSDYRGEIIIPLHNDTDKVRYVEKGERIAQLLIMPVQSVQFEEVDAISDSERGDGGFGSTGR